jgi:hypothetical protein
LFTVANHAQAGTTDTGSKRREDDSARADDAERVKRAKANAEADDDPTRESGGGSESSSAGA